MAADGAPPQRPARHAVTLATRRATASPAAHFATAGNSVARAVGGLRYGLDGPAMGRYGKHPAPMRVAAGVVNRVMMAG